GSKPITSKRLSTSSGSWADRYMARSTPEPPGPPGLTSSEPIRPVWSWLRTRTRDRWKLSAGSGGLQSWGTWTVAHSDPMPRAHLGAGAAARRAQRGGGTPPGGPVGAGTRDQRGMSAAVAVRRVGPDLDHPLPPQRLPGQVLLAGPPPDAAGHPLGTQLRGQG